MKFFKPDAAVFVPDGLAAEDAFRRVTHLGIGAHQDDLEIMAFHGIQKCFGSRELWFGGVTCTDGAGSPRAGEYASFTDADMAALRRREQELRAWADRTHSAARRLYQHPATVLVARTDGGRLIAPWDDDASTREFLEATREPRFASRIRQGEQAELVERQPARASAAYREALRMSRRPEQRGQALVLLARALGKSSGPTRATTVHEEILALPSGIVDDQGLPIRLYGASQLAKQPGHEETLAAALREILAEPRWLSPAALYLLRDLSASIAAVAPDLPKAAERRLLEVEQVLGLELALAVALALVAVDGDADGHVASFSEWGDESDGRRAVREK